MRNNPRQLPIPIKNNPISPRTTPLVNLPVTQNRKLIIRARDGELEPLVVVVFVRVVAASCFRAGGIEIVAGLFGGGYGGGGVADVATGVGAGGTFLIQWEGKGEEGEGCKGCEEELVMEAEGC